MSETLSNIQKSLGDAYSNASDSISSTYNNAAESVSSGYNTVAESGPVSSVSNAFSSTQDYLTNTMNEFSSKSVGQASTEFLESNSLIARFSFVLLVVIIFMILLRLGIYLVGYFTEPSSNPYLISGMIPGSDSMQITQDPKVSDSVTVLRSNNEYNGIEFTWSVWLNITNINNSTTSDTTVYQHIFNKGDNTYGANGIATVNNAPGLYLSNSTNPTLRIIMNTVSSADPNGSEYIDIDNVPLKKWFHLAIRLRNKNMDIYLNGVITGRVTFTNVPKQNYQDVFVCQNSGFSGYLSDLRYYSSALNIFDINNIVMYGPNLNSSAKSSSSTSSSSGYSYLSSAWYTNKL
jgi:hypothetical protein